MNLKKKKIYQLLKFRKKVNNNFIDSQKEMCDIENLYQRIVEDEWIVPDTVIVNCCPEKSSLLTQILNHKLAFDNKNQLFETIDFKIPSPDMSQVWNSKDKEYQLYDYYINNWINTYLEPGVNYLFVTNCISKGNDFSKLESQVRKKLSFDKYRFASLYLNKDAKFNPDYHGEKFKASEEELIFWWDDINKF